MFNLYSTFLWDLEEKQAWVLTIRHDQVARNIHLSDRSGYISHVIRKSGHFSCREGTFQAKAHTSITGRI